MRTPMTPPGSAPSTPPIAQAMKPMVTSSGRTPKRSVPCRENQVVNVWNVSWTRNDATKTARRPGSSPRSAVSTASKSERKVASAAGDPETGGSRSAILKAAAIARTVTAATRNAVRIPSIRPSIRNTTAPTHIWNITEPVARER